jgi:hypothetical protein
MSPFKPAVVTAGVLLAASDVLEEVSPGTRFSEHVVTPTFRAGALVGLVATFALALALIHLHTRSAGRAGRGALAVAVSAGIGVMLLACLTWSTAFVDPAAASVAPGFVDNTPPGILVIGYFGSVAWFGLSWLAYAIVMLRTGVFARPPVVVLLLGGLAAALPVVPFAMVVFGIALAWLGLAPARAVAPQPVPAV